jgi:PHD/YefM family antitoxin component YafN of YafNO toxin-antitoxin module
MTTTMKSEEARARFRDILDTTIAGGAVVIERYSKPTAVVINYDTWRTNADELARLRRIVEADRQFAEMDAGNYVALEDLDKELAAMNAHPSKP